ncbi:MAG TPA: response regulator transcription factor [Terriglobales bacterium]|jgi:DNA-binding NarL/FixJ family response regulator
MRILIADDNALLRRGVTRVLSDEPGWEICGEAMDGADVLQKARELHPDVVVLDIRMPGYNGFEAAHLLRKEFPALKILIMSQFDPAELLPRAREAGADGCVDKARIASDLTQEIKKLAANF